MEGTKGIDIINRNKKFYTEKGVEALETRAKTLITLFNNNKFPIHQDVFGFGKLNIEDSLECLARITELCNLIGFEAKLNLDKETKKAEITYDN